MKRWGMTMGLLGMIFGAAAQADDTRTAYDFSFTSITGEAMPLSAYKDKVLLVVNTASECGFTPQYEGLEKLWQAHKDEGLVIIGVPANNFGGQEPGSNEEIKQFCESRYRITFPMTAKTDVTGDAAHPFYQWIATRLDSKPRWNFHKYLIARDGQPVDYYSSLTKPDSSKLEKAIEAELSKAAD